MRRRASSSRTVAATCRLCSSDSCLSVVCVVTPLSPQEPVRSRTAPHRPAQARHRGGGPRLNNVEHHARTRAPLRHNIETIFEGARHMAKSEEISEEIQTGIHSRPFRPIRLAIAQSVTAILLAIAAFLASLQPAWSMLARPGDARSGSLLLKHEGSYTEAARLGIDVDLTVSGPTIRGRVTQIFRNPTNEWIEAIYVYPLAEGGAV